MSKYILSCCSTVDITDEHLKERDIHYICFHYSLDGVERPDDLGRSLSYKDFYSAMTNGADTKTSQVGVGEYLDHFVSFAKDGYDILHVTLSSGLSGTFTSATLAAKMCMDQYPDRKIIIVDSLGASAGSGLLMDTLADLRDGGMELEELAKWAEDNRLRLHHWFFSTDLTFYVKGGRVSKTAGAIGGLLGICPLLNMDNLGRLIPREKIRPKKRVIARIVEKMKECADGGLDYNGKCFISNSDCYEDACAVAKLIEEAFPNLNGKPQITSIGTTIGSHTGPGTVALFFWGSERCD